VKRGIDNRRWNHEPNRPRFLELLDKISSEAEPVAPSPSNCFTNPRCGRRRRICDHSFAGADHVAPILPSPIIPSCIVLLLSVREVEILLQL